MSNTVRHALALLAVVVLLDSAVALAAELLQQGKDLAPTIAEQQPESLWQFLQALPKSREAELFWGLMIGGTIGMIGHYVLKWTRNEIVENLFVYLWINKRSTLYSFFSYVGVAIAAIGSNAFTVDVLVLGIKKQVFVGWKVVLWMGVTNGFTIDAIVNRTKRAEWDWNKRLEVQRQQESKESKS